MPDQVTTKPFSSRAQAGWAFATGQPWARRWAGETGPYKRLPYKVRKKAPAELATTKDYARAGELAELPALKGVQLAPGVTRIHGDLCNVHGRYGSCRAAGYSGPDRVAPKQLPRPPKGRARGSKRAGGGAGKAPVKTPEQKRAETEAARQAKQADNRKKVADEMAAADAGLSPSGSKALLDFADGGPLDPAMADGLSKRGLIEIGEDGQPRLSAAGRAAVNAMNRGDTRAALDAISRGGSRAATATERAKRRLRGGGGGGGAKKPPGPEIPAALVDAAGRLSAGSELSEADWGALIRNGLARVVKGQLVLTAAGMRAVQSRTKSFVVFKDATGAYRWLSRTTTAFEDRDREVISTKALALDVARADGDGRYGPLRWWHVGKPDPLNVDAPWGPGIDLGWCDFNALSESGRTLIESGTFKSEAIARAVAGHAGKLELSPGFFHAVGEPDASGVFHHIRRFERSLVPVWAGRASNYFTGLVVEKTMDQKKLEALKALGMPEAAIEELLGSVEQTEKAADAEGVRYKEAHPVADWFRALIRGETPETATKEAAPAPAAVVVATPEPAPEADPVQTRIKALEDEIAALKAPPIAEVETQAAGDMPMDMPMDAPAEEDSGGLTLSPEDLAAIGQVIGATLEPLIGALGITQKLESGLGELKTMMGGYVKQKDDAEAARTAEIAGLKTAIETAQAKLAELTGDAPRGGYRPTVAGDNTPWTDPQVLAAIKDGTETGNGFDDLTKNLFPGILPG